MIYLFSILFLSQSCTIYRSKNISLDEAVETESKVRVKTTSNRNFVFKRIEKDQAVTYGIARKNSKAAAHFVNNILPESVSNNRVKIALEEKMIQEINPKNKTMSAVVGIIVGFATVIGLLALALSNMAFLP